MTYVLLLLLAAAIAFWPFYAPKFPALGPSDLVPTKPPHLAPTYQSAIADLAHVRLRLLQTQTLTEQTKAAIDTLTLALVAGSDQ